MVYGKMIFDNGEIFQYAHLEQNNEQLSLIFLLNFRYAGKYGCIVEYKIILQIAIVSFL